MKFLRDKECRTTIGQHGVWTVAQAPEKVREYLWLPMISRRPPLNTQQILGLVPISVQGVHLMQRQPS